MPTANDLAWQRFISKTGLHLDGSTHVVAAKELKKIARREPRLLANPDSPTQLPYVLRERGYAVLPITNGKYLVFKGNIFASLLRDKTQRSIEPRLEFPLATVGRGTGESEYLDNAFNTGLVSEFTHGGLLYLTIRGKERTRPFSFRIDSSGLSIDVDGVQIEVDGGYEGEEDIILIEAKIGHRSHFNVRQLYYPFRHFRIVAPQKRVRTLLFEYDLRTATYAFYEFAFDDPFVFDSIRQIDCSVYSLVVARTYQVDELLDARFESTTDMVPQADDLNKVLELLTLINSGQNAISDIADYFVFDQRQSNYYGEAAEYLGLITRERGIFDLTDRGREFLASPPSDQQRYIAKLVLNSWLFRELVSISRRKGFFTDADIEEVIATARTPDNRQRYTQSTVLRRRQTIAAWARWLAEQIGVFTREDERYYLS